MKKWTSVLAVLVATLMIAGGAMAQGAGGGSGAGPGGGSPGASGTGSVGGGAVGTPGTPTTSGSDKSKAESPAGTPSTGTAAPSASPTTDMHASADFAGRHTMEGEVVKVDPKKGHLTLKTAEGNMDLHFPASALQNVKKGDRISVELAMKPAGAASLKNDTKGSASPKTEDPKKSEKKY